MTVQIRYWYFHPKMLDNKCDCHGSSKTTFLRVTRGVIHWTFPIAQWSFVPDIGLNLKEFIGIVTSFVFHSYALKYKLIGLFVYVFPTEYNDYIILNIMCQWLHGRDLHKLKKKMLFLSVQFNQLMTSINTCSTGETFHNSLK